MLPTIGEVAGDKDDLRRTALRRRSTVPSDRRSALDRARTARLLAQLADVPGSVAAYLSEPAEPATDPLLDALLAAGRPVLVPVLRREPAWAWYEGPHARRLGRWGIPEPTGPPLGPEALSDAAVVLMPGLLGTPYGDRLGRGGGWYDRALAHARPDAHRWLLLDDEEVIDRLPVEPHDLPVTAIATPTTWISCTARRPAPGMPGRS